MAEVLTESFCERCGTRYTFESAQPRVKRLKGVKVLSRGLKNFVLSDDSSLDEAMAAARSDTDREVTAQQLDAFHQTFNFCMTCRQYTCANCWNEGEGACLTCAPHLGREVLPAPFPNLDPTTGLAVTDEVNGNGHVHDEVNGNGAAAGAFALGAWPASDLMAPETETPALDVIDDVEPIDAAARLAALTAVVGDDAGIQAPAEAEMIGEAEAILEAPPTEVEAIPAEVDVEANATPADAEPDLGASSAPIAETDEVAAAAAAQTAALLHRFRPGQNLDAEIEAYEREQAALAASAAAADASPVDDPVVEPLVAAALLADAAVGPVAEVVATDTADIDPADAAAEPEDEVVAEPVAAEDDPSIDAAAVAAAAALAARQIDVVEQPTWQIVAPDSDAPVVVPPMTPSPPATNGTPEWPAKAPEWPAHAQATSGLPFLGRPAQPTGGLESLWAESNREVASAPPVPGRPNQGGVQPCVSCGLSLSATARFCRRCGTSQVA